MQDWIGVELVVEFLDRVKLYRIIDDFVFHFSSFVDELERRKERGKKLIDLFVGLLVGQLIADFLHVGVDSLSPAQ